MEALLDPSARATTLASFLALDGFVQQLPSDGTPARHPTRAFLGRTDSDLHVVFVATDPSPDAIRGRRVPRESLNGEDAVTVWLDTDGDRRRAYVFRVNPRGVQWDALWTEGQGFDVSYDAVWHSDGRRTEQGYIAWISIPFRSLRFDPDAGSWGLVLSRSVPRGQNELSYWPRVSSGVEGVLTQAAALQPISSVPPSRNLNVIPYASVRSFRTVESEGGTSPRWVEDPADPRIGLDVKAVFDDRVVVDLTANPDFAQVESDRPQVTVNRRFEAFFPERRPFFTENADYFRTPMNLVFTRRVLDPQFGARVTGKAGPWAMAAFAADDAAPAALGTGPDDAGRAFVSAGRLIRDVGAFGRLGALVTTRDLGDHSNHVFGLDGRARLLERWTTTFQGARSQDGDEPAGHAAFASLGRSGSAFTYTGWATSISPSFTSDLGFIPRRGILRLGQFASWFRRSEGALLAWGPELAFQRLWDHDGVVLETSFEPSLEWTFAGNVSVEFNYDWATEALRPGDLASVDRIMRFDVSAWDLEFGSQAWDWFRVDGSIRRGHRIHLLPASGGAPERARWNQVDVDAQIQPSAWLSIDNTVIATQFAQAEQGARILDDLIVRSRWDVQFNRELSLRIIGQFERTRPDASRTRIAPGRRINADLLLRFQVNPWTAAYVGYNGNLRDRRLDLRQDGTRAWTPTETFHTDGRQLFVKLSYLIRP